MVSKKKTKKKTTKLKTRSLFQHLDSIYTDQRVKYWDELELADQKTYSPYMINRLVSMTPDYIEVVNELQKYYGSIGPRESYLFYSQLLPRKKMWSKYIKASSQVKYESWMLELLSQYFQVSQNEIESYLEICMKSEEGKMYIGSILEKYGVEQKLIKKGLK